MTHQTAAAERHDIVEDLGAQMRAHGTERRRLLGGRPELGRAALGVALYGADLQQQAHGVATYRSHPVGVGSQEFAASVRTGSSQLVGRVLFTIVNYSLWG